jgi:hypothetical protein
MAKETQRSPAGLYSRAQELEAGFIANVILGQHRNPSRKLRGLVRLLETGHQVATGPFSIDVLLVDDERKPWNYLESVGQPSTK